jgi:segregation and condensation protein B
VSDSEVRDVPAPSAAPVPGEPSTAAPTSAGPQAALDPAPFIAPPANDSALEPNQSAEGRSSSGPLVRGLEPNQSAEGRSSSGPPVPGLEGVEPAAIDQPVDEEAETPFDKLASRARRFSPERIRTLLEALLLVTDKPLSLESMQRTTGVEVAILREQLGKLQGHYRDGVRGIVLHEVAGGWQLRTDASTSEFVRRFLKVKPQRLTRAALETLAIVAYRQPVTRPEIEDVRAVDSGAVVKALLERRLIKIIGKKEEPGRPLLYGTTPEFLEFFNLKDLASLPTLREFQELSAENQAVVEKEAGAEPPLGPAGLVAALKDPGFEERLAQTSTEADAALAELETAMADTESRAHEARRLLEHAGVPDASQGKGDPGAEPGTPTPTSNGEPDAPQDAGSEEG